VRGKPRREIVARREGRKASRDRFAPAIGSLEATWPLSLIQIDHTLVDVIVVDTATRKPIQRPCSHWQSMSTPVASRDFTCRLNRRRHQRCALHRSRSDAQATVAGTAKIEEEWPVQGLFARLHLDNAKEFHSEALRRGCEQYGIAIDYRPVRTRISAATLNDLIGTMMGRFIFCPERHFSTFAPRRS